jgi:serine/threonine-protein kinase
MPLLTGSRLGPYEIRSAIGAGGMGEVYRARDTKLGRDVAIKVLPEAFARDAERMARFQREAKVLASLNHPNIASIYGLEDSGSTRALVMELVEGPTLADRIKAGPIPVDEAVRIAKQTADALEYAHERGVIHRDLKPANVKVTNDDAVKVLDFGLAKALEDDPSSIDISTSPTISRMATMQGVLLGTAAYMSPEQAKGRSVDRRADIWSFGCVLYEMLTGKVAFPGESVTDTLATVIRAEPDWSLLSASTPMRVRVLLQRCLQKDPKQRLRDIGDARISLDEVLSGVPEAAPSLVAVESSPRRRWLWMACGIAALLIVGAATGFTVWNLKPSAGKPVSRTVINLPPGDQLAALDFPAIAISPDGTQLAYVAIHSGTRQIYLRALDSLEAKPVAGTEGARSPFFSHDGQWLGFFASGNLKKISVSGGAAVIVDSVTATPRGASWSSTGTIAFTPSATSPLQQVSDAGGASQPLTQFDRGETGHRWPDFLPGGQAVLFATSGANPQIAVQSLRSGERRNFAPGGTSPRYAASGHLIYAQGGNLMGAAFDARRLQVTGSAVPVLQGVVQLPSGGCQYGLSTTGSLIYVPGGAQTLAPQERLVWVGRSGAEQALAAPPHNYIQPRLSPDGKRLAVAIAEQETQIWLYDLSRDTLTRLTFGGSTNGAPAWTPDGKRIAFTSSKEGQLNIFWELADGSGGLERLAASANTNVPVSFSPDGQLLAYVEINPTTSADVWVLRLREPSAGSEQGRKAQPFLQTSSNETNAMFSSDGHWLAYVSDESGRNEVYVQPYPGPGGKYQVSTEGGTEPVWNRNGKELFYRSGDKMMAVGVATQPSFSMGKPRMLFQGPYAQSPFPAPFYDVSPDGQRFLMVKPPEQTASSSLTQIVVVLNWTEELKRLVPTGK